MGISDVLRRYLDENHMTQTEFRIKNNLPLSKGSLNHAIRTKNYSPRPETLKALAAAMDMTTDELIAASEAYEQAK